MSQRVQIIKSISEPKALRPVWSQMKTGIVVALLVSLLPFVSLANEPLILDCSVSSANPIFDLADFPEGAAMVRMERYRFVIIPGASEGLATTPRAANLPAKVVETENHFEIHFENKRVIVDRFTAEFQVWIQGAKTYLGSGSCVSLRQRRF